MSTQITEEFLDEELDMDNVRSDIREQIIQTHTDTVWNEMTFEELIALHDSVLSESEGK